MGDIFKFKHFRIDQTDCAMKVGTDSMLLGATVRIEKNVKRILDIGAGTGILSLMLAQRSKATVVAIEPDPVHFRQCTINFKNSPFLNTLQMHACRLQDFSTTEVFDLIVSNPPYFPYTLAQTTEQRKRSRSSLELPFAELALHAARLLSSQGSIWLIVPYDQKEVLKRGFIFEKLYPVYEVNIRSYPHSDPVRSIIKFCPVSQELVVEEFCIYREPGKYSADYIALTKEYHDRELG